MDIINEFDDENEWDLSILENSVNQCIDTNDLDQGLRLARKGLGMAFEVNGDKWINTFENLISYIKNRIELIFEENKNKTSVVQEPETLIGAEEETMQLEGQTPTGVDLKIKQVAKVKKIESKLSFLDGIGPKTIDILEKNGIQSIEQLSSIKPQRLHSIKGIGVKSAEKYINTARLHLGQAYLTEYIGESKIPPKEDVISNDLSTYMEDISDQNLNLEKNDELNEDDHGHERNEESCESEENISEVDDSQHSIETMLIEEIPSDGLNLNGISVIQEDSSPEQAENHRKIKNYKGKKAPLSPLQAEKLTQSEIQKINGEIESDLKSLDYWILNKKMKKYSKLSENIDILAVRAIEISDFLELISIFPIKISSGKGKHRIYEEEIKYVPENRKTTLNIYNKKLLIDSNIDILKATRDDLYTNITQQGHLFKFLSKYLKKPLKIEKSITKKEIFLTNGQKYYEVLICPVLIVDNEVEFLESSMAPFAWQRNDGLYIIDIMNIKNFIQYVEKKYIVIESHGAKKDLIDNYVDLYDKFFSRISYFTIPFMLYGGMLLFIALVSPSLLPTFIALGIGLILLLVLGIGFFILSLAKTQSALHDNYMIPYYKRPINFDESGIIMIKEDLPEEWMHQLIYECDMNTKQFDTVRSIEIEGHLARVNKDLDPPEEKETYSEEKTNFRPSMAKKYNKFLED